MSPLQLYVVLLGGKHPQANIEVHDIVPVITDQLCNAYTTLKSRWFGQQKGLHIDAWMQIHGVMYQGLPYQVVIQDTPPTHLALKLYLINLGGYIATQFGEAHDYFVVAGKNAADAKQQGKLQFNQRWQKPHTDAVVDIDDCLELRLIDQHYIHLQQANYSANHFKNDYLIIS